MDISLVFIIIFNILLTVVMDSSKKRKNTIISYFQKKSRSDPLAENNEVILFELYFIG